ncbi:hypothetical protein F2Q69_00055591 [Brassica cretica]|uniref:Uncharacterized protein n=1 Tax=Brassica cretica TaxID=69181 RepID=A0A8S9N1B8_BRACR|nr:hypothetical protein F2Q69_00055591 [Brassica cretica]
MSSSPSEKKSSDVEMGEANSALPTPAMHEATPTFVAGFLSFKERLSRRSAEKEGGRIQPEVPAILSSPAMSTSAGGNKSPGDATPLAESAMVPVQVPEVSAQPSGSSTTPVPAPKEEKATELMPPLSRKEELKASDGDFDSILSQLQFECTLTPCSGETERQGPVTEEGGDVASGRGNDEAAEGGNGCEVEDEGSAPRSV